jgi:membrane protein YdbS with pleckstrin-like domain
VSEPLERIKAAGDAEFQRNWRANIWAPITATCLLVVASILWFFVEDGTWFALAYMLVALLAILGMWAARAAYASMKAGEVRLNLVLTILAGTATRGEADDED